MEAERENSTKPSVGQFLYPVELPDLIFTPMHSCNLWSILLRQGGASKYVLYTSFYVSIVSINLPVRRASLKLILRKSNFLVCSALNLGGQLLSMLYHGQMPIPFLKIGTRDRTELRLTQFCRFWCHAPRAHWFGDHGVICSQDMLVCYA